MTTCGMPIIRAEDVRMEAIGDDGAPPGRASMQPRASRSLGEAAPKPVSEPQAGSAGAKPAFEANAES